MDALMYMRLAIDTARRGMSRGNMPFGAVIVRADEVIAARHNVVREAGDPTAHAEVQAIRAACRTLKTTDLSDCAIYSTCEPCCMCLGACHGVRLSAITFGATIDDKDAAGLWDIGPRAAVVTPMMRAPAKIVAGFLREECAALFREWRPPGPQ